MSRLLLTALMGLALTACVDDAASPPDRDQLQAPSGNEGALKKKALDAGKTVYGVNPFPSTYQPIEANDFALINARVFDGEGNEWEGATLVVQDGRIAAIGTDVTVPEGMSSRDMNGGWVTTGIIDVHSHLGVYPSPSVDAHGDGNEVSGAVTAEVSAEHGVWPQDPGFDTARAAGVTTVHILPGSANLFGGRGVTLRNVSARTVQSMKFPDAPYTLKMACGENPKRVYGYGRGSFPGGAPYSRMGNVAGYRAAWSEATEYKRSWEKYWQSEKEDAEAPKRNLELETLMGVLDGEIRVHMHCYRADEMALILDMAKEFGYTVSTFHHAVEAYKVADYLAENGTCAAMWADWWGFKMEAYDGVRENIPLVHKAGACAMIHSDNDLNIQRLNQEVAKAWADGRRLGIEISRGQAWQWLSLNPARSLGIDGETGSLAPGKRADLVIWSADPFSTYARVNEVYLDGALVFNRANAADQAISDFLLGQPALEMK